MLRFRGSAPGKGMQGGFVVCGNRARLVTRCVVWHRLEDDVVVEAGNLGELLGMVVAHSALFSRRCQRRPEQARGCSLAILVCCSLSKPGEKTTFFVVCARRCLGTFPNILGNTF